MEREISQRYESFDRLVHAFQARFTASISPSALALAFMDWGIHLAHCPGKQAELTEDAFQKVAKFIQYSIKSAVQKDCSPCVTPAEDDKRFTNEQWQKWPFNLIHQSFLLAEQWWNKATDNVAGVTDHHEHVVSFTTRQFLDVMAPTNFLFTNPKVVQATIEEGGANLVRGWGNFLEDFQRNLEGKEPAGAEKFVVGENMALSPGEVIFRNDLFELIQYTPKTDKVYAEPILIVPAWIMKYYILDLNPDKSLVKYLVENGHTVFMISWKNPGPEDRDKGMNDYLKKGALKAIDVVSKVVPDQKIHAVGYCLGGTLLALTAATMARDDDERLKTITLLAAQTDFSDAGELMLYIDESQVRYLEDKMWFNGYLGNKEMLGAFQLLRSNDLIWSKVVHDYLMGKKQEMFDLMAWNVDSTRMPYKMHSDYLRKLFLENQFSRGHYEVDGHPIVISDIRVPAFLVATIKDHVSPWRSVHKFNLASDVEEITFLLTNGGHNAGIISEPGHPRRAYQVSTREEGEKYISPDEWRKMQPVKKGSWWPVFQEWLVERSGEKTDPPSMGAKDEGIVPIEEAPGTYVYEK